MTDLAYAGASPGARPWPPLRQCEKRHDLPRRPGSIVSGSPMRWRSTPLWRSPAWVPMPRTLKEFGTSVVPLYGRHPIGLAQQAMTAQTALGGRFTLGIGAASKQQAEERMGLPWDRPFSLTRDFVNGLQPLLAGQAAHVVGDQLTTRATLDIAAPNTPILLAALGPRMLRFAGARVEGTTLGPMWTAHHRHLCVAALGRGCGSRRSRTPARHGARPHLRDRRSQRRLRAGAKRSRPGIRHYRRMPGCSPKKA